MSHKYNYNEEPHVSLCLMYTSMFYFSVYDHLRGLFLLFTIVIFVWGTCGRVLGGYI